MPEIVIDDFRGGRNSLEAQDQIGPNQHSSGQDMWAEVRNLVTRRGKQYNSISSQYPSAVGQTAADSIAIFTGTSISKPYVPFFLHKIQQAASNQSRMVMVGQYVGTSGRMPLQGLFFLDSIPGGQTNLTATLLGYGVGTASVSGTTVTLAGGATTAGMANAGMAYFKHVDSQTIFTFNAVLSDTSFSIVEDGGTLAAGSYLVTPNVNLTRPFSMVEFDVSGVRNLIITDGSTILLRYDGSNLRGVRPVETTRRILTHKNYVFATNDVALQWSALLDATTWPAANTQTITNLGDPIRGAVVYTDHIVIFTVRRMFRLVGDVFDPSNPTYRLEQISVPPDFHFTFGRTAVIHQGVLKFLTRDGWYGYIGGEGITKISRQIQTDTDAFLKINPLNEQRSDSAVAIVHKDRMLCSVLTASGTAGRTWMQDERGAWWNWNRGFMDFALVQYGASGSWLLQATQGYRTTGTTLDAFIHTLDTGTQDNDINSADSGPAADLVTREIVFPAEVELLDGEIETKSPAESVALTLGFSIDRRTYVSKSLNQDDTIGVAQVAGSIVRRHFYIGRVGRSIRFRIQPSNPTTNGTEIVALRFRYRDSRGRRA